MSDQITALQVEALEKTSGPVNVAAVLVDVSLTYPNPPARIPALNAEVSHIFFNSPVKMHAENVEVVLVKDSGIRVPALTLESVMDVESVANLSGLVVEVLRTVSEKKRRPPTIVVAN